jgi:hypothetical protein
LLALVGGGLAIFYGAFDKGRSGIEQEKDEAAKQALDYQKETNRMLRDNLTTALKRLDEATLLITRKDQENIELRAQTKRYEEIWMGRDEQSKKMNEMIIEYQTNGMEIFKYVRKLGLIIYHTDKNVERLAAAIEHHLASLRKEAT